MGKHRKSGRAKANYAFHKYMSELAYWSRHTPDTGGGCNEIAAALRAGERPTSYRIENEDGKVKIIGKADPA